MVLIGWVVLHRHTHAIPTTDGLFYQLQRGSGLVDWINIGEPVERDGTEKCIEEPAAPDSAAFYCGAIVAPPG